MSAFQYNCTCCSYLTKRYTSWRRHLLKESHQIEARERSLSWTLKDLEKTVVVFGLGLINVSKADVLKHFADLALISDYIFWSERPDFCIIQFLTTEFRRNVICTKQIIGDQELFLRPREEITTLEWISICPFQTKIEVKQELDDNVPPNCDLNLDHLDCSHSESSISIKSEVCSEDDVAENEEPGVNGGLSAKQIESKHICEDFHENEDYENNVEAMHVDVYDYEGCEKEQIWGAKLEELLHAYRMPISDWELRDYTKTFFEKLLQLKFPSCVLIPFGYGIMASYEKQKFRMILDAYGHTRGSNCEYKLHMDISKKERKEIKLLLSSKLEMKDGTHGSRLNCSKDINRIDFQYLDLSCTLYMNYLVLAQSCRLMQFFCGLDKRVQPLLIVAQHWSRDHKLVDVESNSIKQAKSASKTRFYRLVFDWLVIFYLVQRNILPSVRTLQDSARGALMHKGSDIAFCDDLELIKWKGNSKYAYFAPVTGTPSAKCIIELTQDMFEFLGDVKFQRDMISFNTGKVTDRRHLARNSEMKAYSSDYVLIQHPLRLNHNMTQFVKKSIASKFTTACKYTAQQLKHLLKGSHSSLNSVDIFLVPDSETSNKDLQVPKKKKKTFTIQIGISKKFRTKALTVENLEMKRAIEEDGLLPVYMKFFTDFNTLVWPVCFSIKITPLSDKNQFTKTSTEKSMDNLLCQPFQGVLFDPDYPESMNWINKNGFFENSLNMFSKMLEQATLETIPSFPDDKLGSPMFKCKIVIIRTASVRRSRKIAQVRLMFTFGRDSMLYKSEKQKMIFRNMYKQLWNKYWNHRLCSEYVDLH